MITLATVLRGIRFAILLFRKHLRCNDSINNNIQARDKFSATNAKILLLSLSIISRFILVYRVHGVLDVNVWYRHSGVGWTVDTSKHCQVLYVCRQSSTFLLNNSIKATIYYSLYALTVYKYITFMYIYTLKKKGKERKKPFDAGLKKDFFVK